MAPHAAAAPEALWTPHAPVPRQAQAAAMALLRGPAPDGQRSAVTRPLSAGRYRGACAAETTPSSARPGAGAGKAAGLQELSCLFDFNCLRVACCAFAGIVSARVRATSLGSLPEGVAWEGGAGTRGRSIQI